MTGKEAYEYSLGVVRANLKHGDYEESYIQRRSYSSVNYYHRDHYYLDVQYNSRNATYPGMYYLYGEVVSKNKLSIVSRLHDNIYVSQDVLALFFVKWQELIDAIFTVDTDLNDRDVVKIKCHEFNEKLSKFAESHGCHVCHIHDI